MYFYDRYGFLTLGYIRLNLDKISKDNYRDFIKIYLNSHDKHKFYANEKLIIILIKNNIDG